MTWDPLSCTLLDLGVQHAPATCLLLFGADGGLHSGASLQQIAPWSLDAPPAC